MRSPIGKVSMPMSAAASRRRSAPAPHPSPPRAWANADPSPQLSSRLGLPNRSAFHTTDMTPDMERGQQQPAGVVWSIGGLGELFHGSILSGDHQASLGST